jgi:uncharacterized protein YqeY
MLSLATVRSDLTTALKSGESVRLGTLRMLLSAVNNSGIAKYGAASEERLTEGDILDTIKKQAKTHHESIEAYEKAGRQELVAKEKAELAVLETYLPKELSDDELKSILAPVVASGQANFGLLMKQAMEAVKGQAEGGRVAGLLKQMLAK